MANRKLDVKVVLLGKECGGKTCLVTRFLLDCYQEFPVSTIGGAFGVKRMVVNDRPLTLCIWDTAGSERYEAMGKIYYRGAKAAILCYDLTDRTSFERIQFWVDELRKNEENCRIYLCGTKYDLVEQNEGIRRVKYHDITDFADTIKAQVFETSSKTGHNITELFTKIGVDFTEDAARHRPSGDQESVTNKPSLDLTNHKRYKKTDCCS